MSSPVFDKNKAIALGEGGQATVYLARYNKQEVAWKRFSPSANPARSEREIDIMTELQQKNQGEDIALFVPIIWKDDESYAMPKFGRDLDAQVDKLTTPEVYLVVRQVARLLDTAHAHKIVHHDIKPANILFRDDTNVVLEDNQPVVLGDWGLAFADNLTRITELGVFMGTPGFAAPEQVAGKRGNPASDIYSLGITALALAMNKGDPDIKTLHGLTAQDPTKRPTALQVYEMADKYLKQLQQSPQPSQPQRELDELSLLLVDVDKA
jgi:serine/threonine protein kinase